MLGKRWKTAFILLMVSLGLVLTACNPSKEQTKESTNNEQTTKTTGNGNISGIIRLDETPHEVGNNAMLRNLAASNDKYAFQVKAINLSDRSEYKTTTNIFGEYQFIGVPTGEYQIIAENDAYAKSGATTTVVRNSSSTTVNIVLKAAGSLNGFVLGGETVEVVGMDHYALMNQGSFELKGLPVGRITLKLSGIQHDVYNNDYSDFIYLPVEIKAGKNTLPDGISVSNFTLQNIWTPQRGVLEAQTNALCTLIFTRTVTGTNLSGNVTVKDQEGKEIAVEIQSYGSNDSNSPNRYWNVVATDKSQVQPGTYTIEISNELSSSGEYTFRMFNSVTRTFELKSYNLFLHDYLSTFKTGKVVELIFAKPLSDSAINTIENISIQNAGNELSNKQFTLHDNKQYLLISGNFESGTHYTITLPKAIQDELDAPFVRFGGYWNNFDQPDYTIDLSSGYEFFFRKFDIATITPLNNSVGVGLNDQISTEFQTSSELDLGSLRVTIAKEDGTPDVYEKDQLILIHNGFMYSFGSENNQKYRTLKGVSLPERKLLYDTEYTVKVYAKNLDGKEFIKESKFRTIKPKLIKTEPNGKTFSSIDTEENQIRGYFNVPVDPSSGTVQMVDGSNDSVSLQCTWKQTGDTQKKTFHACSPEELKPSELYTITWSGFKADDGKTEIPTLIQKFRTPPKMYLGASIENGMSEVDPVAEKHNLKLYYFGKLTTEQQETIKNSLKITSYNEDITADKTHPEPKILFDYNNIITRIILAFTMDHGRTYEVKLSSPLPEFASTTLVTFSTVQLSGDNETGKYPFDGIKQFEDKSPESIQNGKLVKKFSFEMKLPEEQYDENDHNGYNKCKVHGKTASDLLEVIRIVDQENIELPANKFEISDFTSYTGTQWFYDHQSDANENWCYTELSGTIAITVDYNKEYSIQLQAPEGATKAFIKNKTVTKQFKTEAIGELLQFGEVPELNDSLSLYLTVNAPANITEIQEKLTLKINGETPTLIGDKIFPIDASGDYSHMFLLHIARPVHSVITYSLSTNGQEISLFDVNTGNVSDQKIILEKQGILEIIPDLTPVTINKTITEKREGKLNGAVQISFSGMINPVDLGYTAGETESLSFSEVPFEIVDGDGNQVTLTGITPVLDWVNNEIYGLIGLIFELSEPLDATKQYFVKMIENKSIRSLGGQQKMTFPYSATIETKKAELAIVGYINSEQRYKIDGIVLGSGKYSYSGVEQNEKIILAKYQVADGFSVKQETSSISLETEKTVWSGNTAGYYPSNSYFYSFNLVGKIENASGETVETIKKEISSQDLDYIGNFTYIYTAHSSNANQLTLRFSNVNSDFQVESKHFTLLDSSQNVIENGITVLSGNIGSASSEAIIEFSGLSEGQNYTLLCQRFAPADEPNWTHDDLAKLVQTQIDFTVPSSSTQQ